MSLNPHLCRCSFNTPPLAFVLTPFPWFFFSFICSVIVDCLIKTIPCTTGMLVQPLVQLQHRFQHARCIRVTNLFLVPPAVTFCFCPAARVNSRLLIKNRLSWDVLGYVSSLSQRCRDPPKMTSHSGQDGGNSVFSLLLSVFSSIAASRLVTFFLCRYLASRY